jgi:membrane protease YdiL (CAAX protease family)
MTNSAARLVNLFEVAVVFLLREYVATVALTLALAAGIGLPDMPLLRHTYLVFGFVLALLVWVRLRGEAWADFGLIPLRWRYVGFGVLLAIADIVLDSAIRSVSTPLIVAWTGANPHLDAETFAELKGNVPLLVMIIPAAWLFAGFGEEFLFRGYLLTRLAHIFGGSRVAWTLAIIGQAIAFGLAHWYQGPVGMFPIAVGAALSGAVSVIWGRNLWPVMIAHGLVDTLGLTVLYLGLPLS